MINLFAEKFEAFESMPLTRIINKNVTYVPSSTRFNIYVKNVMVAGIGGRDQPLEGTIDHCELFDLFGDKFMNI